jgi:hypothetical protein
VKNQFDATVLLNDLDGGVFMQKLASALALAAAGVVENDGRRKGRVSMEFLISRIGESNQVSISHTLKYKRPTRRGYAAEDDTTETPVYVGSQGRLSIMPITGDLFSEPKEKSNV